MILFDRETLATHSLQGRRNTFTGEDSHKPQLPPEILRSIIGEIVNQHVVNTVCGPQPELCLLHQITCRPSSGWTAARSKRPSGPSWTTKTSFWRRDWVWVNLKTKPLLIRVFATRRRSWLKTEKWGATLSCSFSAPSVSCLTEMDQLSPSVKLYTLVWSFLLQTKWNSSVLI